MSGGRMAEALACLFRPAARTRGARLRGCGTLAGAQDVCYSPSSLRIRTQASRLNGPLSIARTAAAYLDGWWRL